VRFFGWRSFVVWFSRKEEKGRGGEGAGACGGRVGGEAAGLILVFSSTYFAYSGAACLLACLHTLLTLGGGRRGE